MPSGPMRPTSRRLWLLPATTEGEPTLDKIAVLDGLVRQFKNFANLEFHRLKVRLEQGEVRVGQCSKQSIFKEVWRGGTMLLPL